MTLSESDKIMSDYIDKHGVGFILEEMQKEAVRLAGHILDYTEINEKYKVGALNGIIRSLSKMELFEMMLEICPNMYDEILKEWKDASISTRVPN